MYVCWAVMDRGIYTNLTCIVIMSKRLIRDLNDQHTLCIGRQSASSSYS